MGPLELTGLMSNTEYECAARLFKDDGNRSEWSGVWSADTQESTEEPETTTMTTTAARETTITIETQEELDNIDNPIPRFGEDSAADSPKTLQQKQPAPRVDTPAPPVATSTSTSDSSGNLNFGSFLAVTLVSTSILFKTTAFF